MLNKLLIAVASAGLVMLVYTTPLGAQYRSQKFEAFAASPSEPVFYAPGASVRPVGRLVGAGAVGAFSGLFFGGVAGIVVAPLLPCEGDRCGFGSFLLGAAVGETVAVPLFVHLANDRQGQFTPSLLASAAILAAGLIIADPDDPALLLSIPVLQIASSITIERLTSR